MTVEDKSPESVDKTMLRGAADAWLLKSNNGDKPGIEFPLSGEHYVGREECDILINDPHLSRRHAKLTLKNGELTLEDLKSANGTFVNGVKIESAQLNDGDVVGFDMLEFMVIAPVDEAMTMIRPPQPEIIEDEAIIENATYVTPAPVAVSQANMQADAEDDMATKKVSQKSAPNELQELLAEAEYKRSESDPNMDYLPGLVVMTGSAAGKVIRLSGDMMTIGRKDVDIPLDDKNISTKHAQLSKQDGKWKIVDQMSVNGVYVNGKKTQSAFLLPGDILRFGQTELRFKLDKVHKDSTGSQTNKQTQTDYEDNADNKIPGWLYIAIGFGIVLVIGAYLLSYYK